MEEMNKQIKMGWERGFQLGLFFGIVGSCTAFTFIAILVFLIK